MRIDYFGHAAVGLTSRGGTRVLLDPYLPGAFDGRLGYGPIPGTWDVVIISHDHLDHNHVAPSFGHPVVVTTPQVVNGMSIQRYVGHHGTNLDTMEEYTAISRFVLDDMTIVHPGDLAGPVGDDLVASLRGADVLFLPVGGRFTFTPEEAQGFVNRVAPRLVIPIHFKTPQVDLPLRPVDEFLDRASSVRRFAAGSVDVHTGSLPPRTQVWYLPPQCRASELP